ncbi:hypothetical protein [Maridesulfovibrio sp. FT414]|uniref:hypothetical protein n=1 Tax=Maridesulfovibrio sp. FT414 TaxID=2979469 RepID=UPI003D8067E7
MTPDSPEKQGKEEVIDLGDVAEELGGASAADDLDASFEKELEDLFSEDLELEEPELVAEEDGDEMLVLDDVVEDGEDLLVLDDVVEDESGDDLIDLDDVVGESGDDDLLVLDDVADDEDDALVLDDIVVDDELLELDDVVDDEDEGALVLDDILEDGLDADLILDDMAEEDETDAIDLGEFSDDADDADVLDNLPEISLDDSPVELADTDDTDDGDDIDFDLGEADLLAVSDSDGGELDADGLDGLIDDLGGEATLPLDEGDLEEFFDGDTEVEDLDKLLDEPQSDDMDELDNLLGTVEDEVDLVNIGEDVLADEDIEGLLGDEHEEIEITEEGLEPLEEAVLDVEPVAPEAVAEPVDAELVEAAAEEDAIEVEPEIVEDVVDASAEVVVEPVVDFAGDLELVDDEDLGLDDDDIDLGELLEDTEIDFSEFETEDEEVSESVCEAEMQDVAINSARIEELIDRLDLLESRMPDVDAMIEAHAGEAEVSGQEDIIAGMEEKAAAAAKRAEGLEISLNEATERIASLESALEAAAERVAQVATLEASVAALNENLQILEERLQQGVDVDSAVNQKLSEALKPDSVAVLSVAAIAANDVQNRVEERIQLGLREIQADSEARISSMEDRLKETPDMEPRVAALEERIDGVSSESEARVADLEGRLDEAPDLEPRIGDIESRLEQLPDHEPRLSGLESRIAEMPDHEPRLAGVESRIEALPDHEPRIAALEERLESAPDIEELVGKVLEKELDPDSPAFYRIKTRLTEDIEDYLAPRLVEKIDEMKKEIEESFKSTIDDVLTDKLERAVPAEAARIIREEIAALARELED